MWFEQGLANPVSDYADVQTLAVRTAQPGDILVEVGCFVGESIAHLVDLTRAASKTDLRLYAVDLFDVAEMCRDGSHGMDQRMNDAGLTPNAWIAQHGPRCMLADFYRNLAHGGRDQQLTAALVMRSVAAAELFPDQSIRYCFLDAGHSYENLTADLYAWHRKVRADGIFAGHDWFSGEQIRRAVVDFARQHGLNVGITQSSWILFANDSPLRALMTPVAAPPVAAPPVAAVHP